MSTAAEPDYAFFFGAVGTIVAVVASSFGASFATGKCGIATSVVSVMRPDLMMKSILPVVMGGIVGIYGLVVGIIITTNLRSPYTAEKGFAHFGGGCCVGFCGLAAGIAIGVVGDAGVRGIAQQPRLFIGMLIILIFGEVLGLYGLIVGLLLTTR